MERAALMRRGTAGWTHTGQHGFKSLFKSLPIESMTIENASVKKKNKWRMFWFCERFLAGKNTVQVSLSIHKYVSKCVGCMRIQK